MSRANAVANKKRALKGAAGLVAARRAAMREVRERFANWLESTGSEPPDGLSPFADELWGPEMHRIAAMIRKQTTT